jgi:hypothetical protein
MKKLWHKYVNFVRGVSVNPVGKWGVVLVTGSFVTFILLEAARLSGALTNAYIGLITYMTLPAIFIVGLILIPIGWRRYRKSSGRSTRELLERRFDDTEVRESFFGSKLFLSIASLTLLNVLFLSLASSRMLQFMDEPVFCGTACHSVMNPEWVTYQDSPHARVKCVECHVGEGIDALVDSKLNGLWQIISVTFDLLERPIPTPVHQLRPAQETCEKCHWPAKFYGNRLARLVRFQADSASTPIYTTLAVKIDAGKVTGEEGIHWHIADENRVTYASVNDEREKMIWVEMQHPDGTVKRYTNKRLTDLPGGHERVRVMDCVDCHNRATHIYERPGDAIDEALALGRIDRSLPYIKRRAFRAVTASYADSVAAMEGIANELRGFYRRLDGGLEGRAQAIDQAIDELREIYNRNIHHEMNITWGTYPSHIGHRGTAGCFRCHISDLVAEDGNHIRDDCTLCHSIVAMDSPRPFEYLRPLDQAGRDSVMQHYLQQEFERSLQPLD